MMNYIKLLAWLIISSLFGYLMHSGFAVGDKDIPGLGALLNPNSGVWKNAENASRTKDLELKSTLLNDQVEIIYDKRLVPHIYAQNIQDALFAQGYLEASNRLWQMDFLSREAAGRLSEIIGEKTIRYDIRRRKQGLLYGAELAVKNWKQNKEGSTYLDNYIAGVNYYIDKLKNKDYPVEFKLLSYEPEEWTAIHSALILKTMSSTLASYNEDIRATNTMLEIGIDSFLNLFPVHDPNQSPVIPSDEYQTDLNKYRDSSGKKIYTGEKLSDLTLYKGITGVGSNNWAINAKKALNENPILCNDPHLNLTLPSIWYELHIVTPEINTYGVSIPGMPGVMIGMNEDIAWGNTNVGHDFVDYYTINWTDQNKSKYTIDGKEKEVDVRNEEIKVRGADNINFDLKVTDFGLLYAESEDNYSPDIARDWIAYREHNQDETSVFVNIMQSKNYSEYKKASDAFFAPAQNFLFASKKDTIALRVNGNLPLKYNHEGRFVKEGNSSDDKWNNFIPRAENPEAINPEQGFVSSANQESTSSSYPYYYNGSFEEYRGKRVNQLLQGKENLSIDDMKSMQQDVYSLKAEYFLPVLLQGVHEHSFKSELADKILDMLNGWNYQYTEDNVAAKFFDVWISKFRTEFWKDFLNRKNIDGLLKPEDWVLLNLIQENADLLVSNSISSFEALCIDFEDKDVDMVWKKYRSKSINHLLSIPSFSHSNLEVGGCGDVLNAVSRGIGPSWRMIVELGPKTEALAVFPGGQSGNPASFHYDDSLDEWVNGEYHQIDIYKSKEALKKEALFSVQIKSSNK